MDVADEAIVADLAEPLERQDKEVPMPFRSQAPRRWMYAAEARGELPPGPAERWSAHTPQARLLPERADTPQKLLSRPRSVSQQSVAVAPGDSARRDRVTGPEMSLQVAKEAA